MTSRRDILPDRRQGLLRLIVGMLALAGASSCTLGRAVAGEQGSSQAQARQHSELSFQELSRHERPQGEGRPAPAGPHPGATQPSSSYPSEEFLRGVGEGDLSKGRPACQRVSELAARTDLAKQIRVRVTEHAVDRLHERSGRQAEQDIEVVREEMVNELLRDVRIVDRRIDEATGTCSSIAVMPRARITPDSLSEPHESAATSLSPTR